MSRSYVLTGLSLSLLLVFSLRVVSGDPGVPASPQKPSTATLLRDLEKRMSAVKTVQASFVQEKQLAILSRKVILKGKMILENPGKLAWHVHKPVRYSMVLSDNVMRQWDEDTRKVQKTSLAGNPVWKAVSEQIRRWFSGQYASLAEEYDIHVVRLTPSRVLRFQPRKEAPARKAIQSVTVTFRKDERYVQVIRIVDTSGDITQLTFLDTILDQPIPPGSWEVEPRD